MATLESVVITDLVDKYTEAIKQAEINGYNDSNLSKRSAECGFIPYKSLSLNGDAEGSPYFDTLYGDGSNLSGITVGITTEALTTAGATVTLDLSKDDHKITKSGTYTITCTGGAEASAHTLRIVNSGITTVGFSTYFLFPSGGTPSLPTADGAVSLISFTVHRAGSVGVSTQLLAGASINFSWGR